MAASPVKRYTRYVKPADFATVNNATSVVITYAHPIDAAGGAIFHLASTQDASTTTTLAAPRGTVNNSLLLASADAQASLAGIVTVKLPATLVATNIFLTKIELVDKDGNLLDTIFSSTTGLDGGITNLVANALTGIPVNSGEGVRVTLLNSSGGGITGAAAGVARFDLGVDVQQPDTQSVTKAL